MASSSLLLDNRPPLYSPIHSALGIGIPILPSASDHDRLAGWRLIDGSFDCPRHFLDSWNGLYERSCCVLSINNELIKAGEAEDVDALINWLVVGFEDAD